MTSTVFALDPQLKLFQGRHSYKVLNPSSFSPVVSPTQIRPKGSVIRPPVALPERSPKRQADDSDGDVSKNERPRKIPRGESPIKGAAGRRLMDQQKRAAAAAAASREQESRQTHHAKHSSMSGQQVSQQPTLPDSIMYLLTMLPSAHSYRSVRFSPEEIFKLLLSLNIPAPPPNQTNGVSYFSSAPFYSLLQTISINQHKMFSENTPLAAAVNPEALFQPQAPPNRQQMSAQIPIPSVLISNPVTPVLRAPTVSGDPMAVTPPDSHNREALRFLNELFPNGHI
ncbi:hypothetical protein H072_1418 [Dactylellina haptotyla CBS 200.50]|uniref:Uncharacterized protein n=1 Tax=Dactylellina haptotyla (strain CBS 200.50) TaxID=1284197 RepID=S8CA94_DACHA|nr:hypothetical protein H072_1418 [Dactylellina haptotyla CBS 200.50]